MAANEGFTNKEILLRMEVKVDKILDDHEARIRRVEGVVAKLKSWAPPAGAIAALTTALATYFGTN
jgi:hypothetical protein